MHEAILSNDVLNIKFNRNKVLSFNDIFSLKNELHRVSKVKFNFDRRSFESIEFGFIIAYLNIHCKNITKFILPVTQYKLEYETLKDWERFVELIEKNKNIKKLTLPDLRNIDEGNLIRLSEAIKKLTYLKNLFIDDVNLTEENAKVFFENILSNKSIAHLTSLALKPNVLFVFLNSLVNHNNQLQYLSVSNSIMCQRHIDILAKVLESKALKFLYMPYKIAKEEKIIDFKSILESLKKNNNLILLNLTQNNVNDSELEYKIGYNLRYEIRTAISGNQSIYKVKLGRQVDAYNEKKFNFIINILGEIDLNNFDEAFKNVFDSLASYAMDSDKNIGEYMGIYPFYYGVKYNYVDNKKILIKQVKENYYTLDFIIRNIYEGANKNKALQNLHAINNNIKNVTKSWYQAFCQGRDVNLNTDVTKIILEYMGSNKESHRKYIEKQLADYKEMSKQ